MCPSPNLLWPSARGKVTRSVPRGGLIVYSPAIESRVNVNNVGLGCRLLLQALRLGVKVGEDEGTK